MPDQRRTPDHDHAHAHDEHEPPEPPFDPATQEPRRRAELNPNIRTGTPPAEADPLAPSTSVDQTSDEDAVEPNEPA